MNDYEKALYEFLYPMVNQGRVEILEKNLAMRTRYVTVVLEDIFQSHNASAVLRSCDCFGVQDVHIIENRNSYELNPDIELGAAQWLTLYRHNKEKQNTVSAINQLKKSGYRIVATTPHSGDIDLENFDLSQGKVALLFGTERTGLSDIALELADEYLKIPMVGFTESLNISVSAAIILQHLTTKLRGSTLQWMLQESENEALSLKWIRNSINKLQLIENGFKKKFYR